MKKRIIAFFKSFTVQPMMDQYTIGFVIATVFMACVATVADSEDNSPTACMLCIVITIFFAVLTVISPWINTDTGKKVKEEEED